MLLGSRGSAGPTPRFTPLVPIRYRKYLSCGSRSAHVGNRFPCLGLSGRERVLGFAESPRWMNIPYSGYVTIAVFSGEISKGIISRVGSICKKVPTAVSVMYINWELQLYILHE